MSPSFSPNDAANVGLGRAKACSQINLARAFGVERSDHHDLSVSKLGVMVVATKNRTNVAALTAENLKTVPGVLRRSDNLQVLHPIVILNSVDVIDLHSARDRANEGRSNEAVNFDGETSVFAGIEPDDMVAVLVSVPSKAVAPWASNNAPVRNPISWPTRNVFPTLAHRDDSNTVWS